MVFHIVILSEDPDFSGLQTTYQHIHSPYYEYDGFFYIFIYFALRANRERSYTHYEVYL